MTEQFPLGQSAPQYSFPRCAATCALLAEVNHRTANQFTILASYIHLSLEEFRRNPGEIQDLQLAFAAVEAQARSLASLNKQLINREESGAQVDVSVMLHEICAAFANQSNAIHSVVDKIAGSHFVTPAVNVSTGQIVTEAIMNAVKYAYLVEEVGEITVLSTHLASGGFLVEVVDRGVGVLPPSLSTSAKSFGVRLMRGLARQENIGLSFVDMLPGLSVQLVLPARTQMFP